MDIKELLDDDAFDPKKLFNEKEYSTLIINRDGFNKKENNTADLIESLLEKEITREESEAIFSKLKEMQATTLLVNAIKNAKRIDDKSRIIAACWETGLDMSTDFLMFVEYACHDDFQLALEALSVVENTENIPKEKVQVGLEIALNAKSKNPALV